MEKKLIISEIYNKLDYNLYNNDKEYMRNTAKDIYNFCKSNDIDDQDLLLTLDSFEDGDTTGYWINLEIFYMLIYRQVYFEFKDSLTSEDILKIAEINYDELDVDGKLPLDLINNMIIDYISHNNIHIKESKEIEYNELILNEIYLKLDAYEYDYDEDYMDEICLRFYIFCKNNDITDSKILEILDEFSNESIPSDYFLYTQAIYNLIDKQNRDSFKKYLNTEDIIEICEIYYDQNSYDINNGFKIKKDELNSFIIDYISNTDFDIKENKKIMENQNIGYLEISEIKKIEDVLNRYGVTISKYSNFEYYYSKDYDSIVTIDIESKSMDGSINHNALSNIEKELYNLDFITFVNINTYKYQIELTLNDDYVRYMQYDDIKENKKTSFMKKKNIMLFEEFIKLYEEGDCGGGDFSGSTLSNTPGMGDPTTGGTEGGGDSNSYGSGDKFDFGVNKIFKISSLADTSQKSEKKKPKRKTNSKSRKPKKTRKTNESITEESDIKKQTIYFTGKQDKWGCPIYKDLDNPRLKYIVDVDLGRYDIPNLCRVTPSGEPQYQIDMSKIELESVYRVGKTRGYQSPESYTEYTGNEPEVTTEIEY